MSVEKQRILLVEDEEHLAFTLELNLTQEGYSVEVAKTLHEAREKLKEDFDLFIFDVMLPDGSAFNLCREIRTDNIHTPLLFLTAKSSTDDITEGLEAGGDDYLSKPFSLKELFARITAMLRRVQWQKKKEQSHPKVEQQSHYEFSSFQINFTTHEVHTKNQTLPLTALEIKLLKFFIEREDQIVTRQQLLTDVWGLSAQTNTRSVDNFLLRLRRIFEEDPSSPKHFLTVRGVGYRFKSKT